MTAWVDALDSLWSTKDSTTSDNMLAIALKLQEKNACPDIQ
jgi:hypothetical protein